MNLLYDEIVIELYNEKMNRWYSCALICSNFNFSNPNSRISTFFKSQLVLILGIVSFMKNPDLKSRLFLNPDFLQIPTFFKFQFVRNLTFTQIPILQIPIYSNPNSQIQTFFKFQLRFSSNHNSKIPTIFSTYSTSNFRGDTYAVVII